MEMYGSYNKIFHYLGIFAFLADLGLYTITVREVSKNPNKASHILSNVLSLRIFLGVIVWILSLCIAAFLPAYNDPLILSAVAIIGGFTLVSLINSAVLAVMQAQMKMEFSLISLVSGKILNLIGVGTFLMFIFPSENQLAYAFISVFCVAFFGVLLNTFLNIVYLSKNVKIAVGRDIIYMKKIFFDSLPYGLALFLSVVYFKVDIIILSLIESPELSNISIALYGLPMKIIEVLMVMGTFFMNSLLPTLTKSYDEKNTIRFSRTLHLALKSMVSFGVFVITTCIVFGQHMIVIIASQEYLSPAQHVFNSYGALILSSSVLIFHFIALCFIYCLIAQSKQGVLLKINAFVAIINIVGNLLIIPHYSFIGAASITVLSQLLLMIIVGVFVMKWVGITLKIVTQLGISVVLGCGVGALGYSLSQYMNNSYVVELLLILPLMFVLYWGIEYICSKKFVRGLMTTESGQTAQ